VINHLSCKIATNEEKIKLGLAYIYCDYKERLRQTRISIISSILRQLLQLYRSTARENTVPNIPLDLEGRITSLRSIVEAFEEVFLVVDALDEFSEVEDGREQFLNSLLALGSSAVKLKLFITSRPAPSLERKFSAQERLAVDSSNVDIDSYIRYRIEQKPKLKRWIDKEPDLEHTILSKVKEKSTSMCGSISEKDFPTLTFMS